MLEVRIHGRGGQGVVTAAEVLALAAFDEGRHAQAFPSFGSERMGAPVVSFVRISDDPIRAREPVSSPDVVIVADATLLHQVDLFSGLKIDGYVLINSMRDFDELGLDDIRTEARRDRCLTVPATAMALEHIGRPVPNAVLLGAFAALTGLVSLTSVQQAVQERFPGALATSNTAAAVAAYHDVEQRVGRTTGAPTG